MSYLPEFEPEVLQMINIENYLRAMAQLTLKVRLLRMMASTVTIEDVEFMGRVFGAEIVELGAFPVEEQEECARAENNGWDLTGWNANDRLIRKRLTAENIHPKVQDKLVKRKA